MRRSLKAFRDQWGALEILTETARGFTYSVREIVVFY